jgi:hypothetical protein
MAPKQNALKLPKKLIEQLGGEGKFSDLKQLKCWLML